MEDDNNEITYESGSDESDNEEAGTNSSNKSSGTRDSNAMLDTWLAELDSIAMVRNILYIFMNLLSLHTLHFS